MCLGRYFSGRWTIVEAILFVFLMPTFLRFLLKSLNGGEERKKYIYSEKGADARKKNGES